MKINKGEKNTRTCVVCGNKAEKKMLFRYASVNGRVVIDWLGSLPGRSIYTCPSTDCVRGLYKKKRLSEKFHKGNPDFYIDRDSVNAFVAERARESFLHFLSLARKSGVLYKGQNIVVDLLKKEATFSE